MNGDGAALLCIFPMGAEAILANEVPDAWRDYFQDGNERLVDNGALASGGHTPCSRHLRNNGGDGSFQFDGSFRHVAPPEIKEGRDFATAFFKPFWGRTNNIS